MLDLLEWLGCDLDGLDSGQSLRLHSMIRPGAKLGKVPVILGDSLPVTH